jgi:hypothetical protein
MIQCLTLPRLKEEGFKKRSGGRLVAIYEPYKNNEGNFAVFTFFYRSQGKTQPSIFHPDGMFRLLRERDTLTIARAQRP